MTATPPPLEGFWRARFDDAAQEVVIEAPGQPVRRRLMSRTERLRGRARAAEARASRNARNTRNA